MAKLIHKIVTSCSDCPYFIWDNQVGSYKCWDTGKYFLNGEYQKIPEDKGFYWKQIIAEFCRLEDET